MNSLANDETHGRTEAAEDYRADRMFLGAAIEALGLPRSGRPCAVRGPLTGPAIPSHHPRQDGLSS